MMYDLILWSYRLLVICRLLCNTYHLLLLISLPFDVILSLQMEDYPYSDHKPECEEYGHHMYSGSEYLEGEDGELSWFNAGVRVGVGIGLSVCIGVGLGVGLLIRTYQGTTRTFRRRLLWIQLGAIQAALQDDLHSFCSLLAVSSIHSECNFGYCIARLAVRLAVPGFTWFATCFLKKKMGCAVQHRLHAVTIT